MSIARQVCRTTDMKYIITFVYTQRRILALGPRFGLVLGPQRRLLWLPEVAIWEIFEFLGGLVIHSSYQVKTTTYLKSSLFLFTYARKVFSAWAEVWSGAWPSTASIMAPEDRDLGDF